MKTTPSAKEEIIARLVGSTPWPKDKGPSPRGAAGGGAVVSEDPVERFTAKATAAGAVVQRVDKIGGAAPLVISFLREGGFSSAIIGTEPILEAACVQSALKDGGIRIIPRATDLKSHKEACFAADAGITGVSYGIAETGSLAMVFDEERPRLISHAPFCHIALLPTKDIIPDTETLFARLADQKALPSALAIVTGPSMTADIALTPIRGIHGPGKLLIVLVDEVGSNG